MVILNGHCYMTIKYKLHELDQYRYVGEKHLSEDWNIVTIEVNYIIENIISKWCSYIDILSIESIIRVLNIVQKYHIYNI